MNGELNIIRILMSFIIKRGEEKEKLPDNKQVYYYNYNHKTRGEENKIIR